MSPKPSAFAAPGMERAIIKTNGFFPLDIAYSRVPFEHRDIAVAAVPIAHHGYIFRQMLCDRMRPWIQLFSKTSTQFTHVCRCRWPVGTMRRARESRGLRGAAAAPDMRHSGCPISYISIEWNEQKYFHRY